MPGKFLRWLALAAVVATVAAPLAAQGNGKGKGKGPKGRVVVVHPREEHKFRDNDRQVISSYYHDHHIVVRPLRPEVSRLVVVGRPLPPGIAKRSLDRQLVVLMPPPPPRYSYALVGNRVVLLDDRGWVADVLDGLFN
ncbi:MAG: hypothetical protein ABIZ70_04080 [Gemmatimonadales bacterium]